MSDESNGGADPRAAADASTTVDTTAAASTTGETTPDDAFDTMSDEALAADPATDDLELGPTQDPVAVARRRHGAAGAMLAAGMFGVDIALGRKPREDIPVVVAANDEPVDVDTDGIEISVDEHTRVVAPALPRSEPARRTGRARRSRRTR